MYTNLISKKKLSGTLSECQTVWIPIRTDVLSVLIWVQTVCKGYQQTTKVAASNERVNSSLKRYTHYECVRKFRNGTNFIHSKITITFDCSTMGIVYGLFGFSNNDIEFFRLLEKLSHTDL